MKQSKTICHKILNQSHIFDETIRIYNDVLSFIVEVIDTEINNVTAYSTKDMTTIVEKLIHQTTQNPNPKYTEFNERFYKFPSYLRRSAIASAFRKVKSYCSLLQNWLTEKEFALQSGRVFKKQPPTKQFIHSEFPVFYKGNMFLRIDETKAKIKAYVNNDWVWVDVQFRPQNLEKRGVKEWKECNPKLVPKEKKYFLHFSYETNIHLNETPIQNRRICAVDLGLTNSAVCSIMDVNGTFLARKFINQAREKDQLR